MTLTARIAIIVTVLFLAALAGLIAATGEYVPVALFAGLILGVVLLTQPNLLMWAVILGGLVLSGVVSLYFPGLAVVKWIVPMMGIALALIALLRALSARTSRAAASDRNPSGVMKWLLAFFLVILISAVVNGSFSLNAIISLKGYFQVLGIMLALAYFGFSPVQADRFVKAIVILGFVQLPFALHQFLFLVPERATAFAASHLVVGVDVVVGTFMGSLEGGGASDVFAVFQVVAISILFARWKRGLLKSRPTFMGGFILLLPLMLNETKITFLLLPLAFGLVFMDNLKKQPMKFIGGGLAVSTVVLGIFLGYTLLPKGQKSQSPSEYFEAAWVSNFGDAGYGASELNRTTVLTHWVKIHYGADFPYIIFGHGPGSVRTNALGVPPPLQLKYYGLGIDLTSLSTMLWELGFVGTFAAIGLFWSAFKTAGQLLKLQNIPLERQALLAAAQAGIGMLGMSLFFNNFFIFEIGYQTLLMLLIGYVVYWQKNQTLIGY